MSRSPMSRLRENLLQSVFAALNLALTAPSVYLWLGLPVVMRQHGWSGLEIGLFQLAGLPAVFKFVLAVPVERLRFRGGHYRAWAVLLCLGFAAVLGLLAQRALLADRLALYVLAVAAALMSTWADIPVNALAIRLLPAAARVRAGGLRSAALSLGAIVGGGLMLLVQAKWGWAAPFWVMAGLLVAGVLALLCVNEGDAAASSPVQGVSNGRARGYFAQPGAAAWTVLLLACFPFIGAAWFFLKPLLLDRGFALPQVAWLVGVGGGLVAAVASMVAAAVIRRAGVERAVPGVALLCCLCIALLAALVGLHAPPAWLAVGALLIALAMGAAASLAFGLMMFFARDGHHAADYGLQASLFALSRLVVPVAAGFLLDRTGYAGMLAGLAVAMGGVFVFALGARRAIGRGVAAG